MAKEQCEQCNEMTPRWDIVHFASGNGGREMLCSSCFNARIAEFIGATGFKSLKFTPIRMVDCNGGSHEFHFQIRLLGKEVALNAFELCGDRPAGYRFQLIGEYCDDVFELSGRLIERIRRALHLRHVDFLQGYIINRTLRGRIERDESQQGRLPIVVIDGREVSWNNLGQMLVNMEGYQFRLDIVDLSEEC
ncbi:DUF7686 domain-containing protein [Paraburkholderia kururiensis]|jgi:hypothetical protein|uniref:DUF7686 domain-containing protein n=1 Tax=Paraburkholderia kururiensis TaxID=984307 RepID=UPI0018F71908|nr:hypothetical protein [Paraburkholderia kururiensis]